MKIVWNTLTKPEWAALLPPTRCALQQSWNYSDVIGALGREIHRAVISDADGPLALAQLITRDIGKLGHVALLSRGPILLRDGVCVDQNACIRLIKSTMPTRGLTTLIATPERDGNLGLPLMTPSHMAEIALSKQADTMRTAMHGKWRNRLVRAEKSNLRISKHTDQTSLDWLIAKDLQQQRTRGYRALPPRFLKAWFAKGNAHALYIAASQDEPVAAMLFLDHRPGATYQIGWTSGTGRALSAHNLILWHAMQDFAETGHARLDLGTLDTVNAPGLARFKLGAGAKIRALGNTSLIFPSFCGKTARNTLLSRVLTQRSLQ